MLRKKGMAIALSAVLLAAEIMSVPGPRMNAMETDSPVESSTIAGSGLSDTTAAFSYYESAFGRYGSPLSSYLTLNDDDTISRVEADENTASIRVETYERKEGKLLSSKTLDMKSAWEGDAQPPLKNPLFGGVFIGDMSNYVFLGQANPEEKDDKEVIRIVRYDKQWNVKNQYNLYQNNTVSPFEAGSLRCAEYGDMLYVYTCHKMYKAEDGYNHQANLRFTLNKETGDIPVSDQHFLTSNERYGYCSHSFNQFITIQGQDIYTLDHGDAYPRGIQLARYAQKAGGEMGNPDAWQTVVSFPGNVGDNETNTAVGGLAVSDQKCLIPYSQGAGVGKPRSVYLTTMDRQAIGSGTPQTVTLDTPAGGTTYGVPMMTQIGEDNYLLRWQVYQADGDVKEEAHYCVIDASGNTIVPVNSMKAYLADCQPAVDDGGIVLWYTTGTPYAAGTPVFYELNPYNGKLKKTESYTKKKLEPPVLTMVRRKAGKVKGTGPVGATIRLQFKGETFTKLCKNGTFTIKLPKKYVKKLRFGATLMVWATKDGYDDSPKTVVTIR